jgi:hypothetical protein
MLHPSMIGLIARSLTLPAMAVGIALALALAVPGAQAFDETKYPDWSGQWHRPRGVGIQWDQTKPLGRGQQAPLTTEYQALFEASLADQSKGGQGEDARFTCIPPGMPRIMTIIWPAEFVILPKITYVNFENHMPRRIYTDGRSFPTNEEPSFQGYSIGQWRDTNGDGNYDTLEVDTRNLKGPRTFETTGLPMHKDNQTVVKERITLDKDNPDILVNEITTMDNALTRPWTVIKTYRRERNFIWFENICAEGNAHVAIGKENYMMSADGLLMPARKNQAPPDLRYFQQR